MKKNTYLWNVRLTFQYPAWDEKEGITYEAIQASCASMANFRARNRARNDGHLCGGKGRVTFKTTKAKDSQ